LLDTGGSPASVLATLRVRSGLPAGAALPVRLPQVSIGSDPANDIVVEGPGVAPRHAEIRLRGGIWTLIDFGSTTGSSVDGSVVRGEALLAPGSSLQVGSVEFAFAPSDRWQDSPPERRGASRAPILILPQQRRNLWPTVAFVVAVCGVFAAAYFLLRNG
jgi:pSer/pThr/pTyr-binding forkhead associated (FHA) protein